jgi:hypothetical protein
MVAHLVTSPKLYKTVCESNLWRELQFSVCHISLPWLPDCDDKPCLLVINCHGYMVVTSHAGWDV